MELLTVRVENSATANFISGACRVRCSGTAPALKNLLRQIGCRL